MLPLLTQQCNLWFTFESGLVGGVTGGFGLIINLVLVRGLFTLYQKYKASKDHGLTST